MHIDIRTIPVIYINMDDAVEKGQRVHALLTDLGFTSITRVSGVPVSKELGFLKVVAVARAHATAMSIMDPPFLIVEDDIQVVDFRPVITIPDDTDAIFLGNMQAGYAESDYLDYADVEPVDGYDDLFKVNSMLSAHAILYLTPQYKAAALADAHASGFVEMNLAHDCYSARGTYRKHNVLMPGLPVFKQSGKYEAITDKHVLEYTRVNPGFREMLRTL